MKAKLLKVWGAVKGPLFNLYVAANMLVCSIIFFGFSHPRETLSGFIGRRALMGSSFFLYVARAVDKLYPREPAHCGETALAEDNMRVELYPEYQDAQVADLPPPECQTEQDIRDAIAKVVNVPHGNVTEQVSAKK